MTTYPISKIRSGEVAVRIENYEQYKKLCEAVSDKWNNEKTYCDKFEYYGMYEGGTTVTYITSTELVDRTLIDFHQIDWEEGKEVDWSSIKNEDLGKRLEKWEEGKKEVIMDDEKYLQVANNLIFKTVSGKFGLTSIDEHDQVDGYYDTYKEAFFSLKLIMQLKELSTLKAENERLSMRVAQLEMEAESTSNKYCESLTDIAQLKLQLLESSKSSQELSLKQRMAWELYVAGFNHGIADKWTIAECYRSANIFLNYKGGDDEQ